MKLTTSRSHLVTNLIDAKIRLQIASIEVHLIGFFFGIRSTFKGRIRSILAMIHDQSCLNLIGIESRTQGITKNSIFCSKLA